ncbi:MAG: hypothetical protein ACRYG8_39430, partial [Janthinobacterium lividum]
MAGLIAGALYPNGSTSDSVVGTVCKVYRGWPVANALESDLEQGIAHISVVPIAGAVRDRTRYSTEWQGASPPATVTATVSGDQVDFAGPGGSGQVAGIGVDGRAYAYRMRNGDSAALVAAVLAAEIRADRPAVAIGSSVYLLNGRNILARVVTDGQGGQELRRQQAGFRAGFWCPDPVIRDEIVGLVDTALAALTFIDVGGWACRLQLERVCADWNREIGCESGAECDSKG